ncbi:MAG: hypothetical protein A4E68_01905 [Syntrophaceae bacterium PtaB.Bin095]|nr:MAG: hypothetical protein A4E68_01905 [Syntrophaceae bacterium PtaB.Bin095]
MEIGHQALLQEMLPHGGFGIGGQDLAVGGVCLEGFQEFVVFDDIRFIVVRKTENQSGNDHDAIFMAKLHGPARGVDNIALAGRLQIPAGYVFNTEEDGFHARQGHLADHLLVSGHRNTVRLDNQFQPPVVACDDGVADSDHAFGIQHHVVVRYKNQTRPPFVINIVDVRHDAVQRICPEGLSVHVFHAAERTGARAAAGSFHHLDPGEHHVVSRGQAALVPNGDFNPRQIQQFSPGIVHELSAVFVGKGGNVFEPAPVFQGIDELPACFLALSPDHEIDQIGLRRGGDFLVHQCGMVASDNDSRIGQQMFDQTDQEDTCVVLPCHRGEADQLRAYFRQDSGQILSQGSPFADQIDDVDLVPFADVRADAGNAAIGHVKRGLVHDNRGHVRHRQQNDFHETPKKFFCHSAGKPVMRCKLNL